VQGVLDGLDGLAEDVEQACDLGDGERGHPGARPGAPTLPGGGRGRGLRYC
jgi:hypothetical protein